MRLKLNSRFTNSFFRDFERCNFLPFTSPLVLDQTPFPKLYHNSNYGNVNDKWFVVKKMEGLSTVVDHFSGAGGVAENT